MYVGAVLCRNYTMLRRIHRLLPGSGFTACQRRHRTVAGSDVGRRQKLPFRMGRWPLQLERVKHCVQKRLTAASVRACSVNTHLSIVSKLRLSCFSMSSDRGQPLWKSLVRQRSPKAVLGGDHVQPFHSAQSRPRHWARWGRDCLAPWKFDRRLKARAASLRELT